MEYDLGKIIELLEEALTDNEFANLLFGKYRSVNRDTSGLPLPERRRQLVDYAEKKREIPKLLEAIQEMNPRVYEEFKDKLKTISPPLQELIQILTTVDFNKVIKDFRDSIPELSHRPIPKNLELLVRLIDGDGIPGDPDKPKPIWRFVNFLIHDKSLDSNFQNVLKVWAEGQNIPLNSPIQGKSETGETYLMIKVKLHPPKKYIVSAAIVEDPDPLKLDVERKVTKIEITIPPDPISAPSYTQDQLPMILSELIAICGSKGHPLDDLIVQWFLPTELMSLPLEYWQIKTGKKITVPNGESCKAVIVCSSDRHFSSEYQSVFGNWQKYWKRLLHSLKSNSHQVLVHLDPMTGNMKIGWSKDNNNNDDVVGCKFIEHEDQKQQADFWDYLFSQGSPIALWSRQPVTNQQDVIAIMDSLTKCSFNVLPNSLTNLRKESLAKASGATISSQPATQLSLLWDNPFRPFPDIELKSN